MVKELVNGARVLASTQINVAIANNLLYCFTLKDLPEPKYKNLKCRFVENGFYLITRYLFILGHLLLHKLYINVAIANNLLCSFTL